MADPIWWLAIARKSWSCCPACFGCAFPSFLLHEVWYLSNPLVVWFSMHSCEKSNPASRVRSRQLWLGANRVRPLAEAVYEGSAVLGSLTLLIALWSELPPLEHFMGRLKASFWRYELTQSSHPNRSCTSSAPNTWNILFFFSLTACS